VIFLTNIGGIYFRGASTQKKDSFTLNDRTVVCMTCLFVVSTSSYDLNDWTTACLRR